MTISRLFVPAAFCGLVATMPPASATAFERLDWLDRTVDQLRGEVRGPHGLSAIRLVEAIDQVRHATHDEFATSTVSAA
nr:hypothetical protein [Amycolatopsis sp. WAC 01376]